MNNEEAIAWIKSIKDKYIHGGDDDFDEKRKKSLDMAIKALEQIEIWNATTKDRQIIAPKGTFRKIWEDEQQPCEDKGEISDGYHTFNQLYHQRAVLFATIVKQNKDKAWKSFKHSDGKYCFDSNGEWFIVGVDTPQGSYTYHYAKEYWDMFDCQELECGKEWDGHTEEDVTRLLSLDQQSCRDKQDCEHCIHTYGTLGCCDMVNNEWIYDCDFGREQYRKEHGKPCEDCISREALLTLLEEPMNWTDSEAEIQEQKDYENFVALVKSMPIVTPQQARWIPCSERMPEVSDHYLIQYSRHICPDEMAVAYYSVEEAECDKNYTWEFKPFADCKEVIAWMPLPEPYKESEG